METAVRPAERGQSSALPAFRLQIPGFPKIVDVLVSGKQRLLMQGWSHLYGVADHNDETRVRLIAQDIM